MSSDGDDDAGVVVATRLVNELAVDHANDYRPPRRVGERRVSEAREVIAMHHVGRRTVPTVAPEPPSGTSADR